MHRSQHPKIRKRQLEDTRRLHAVASNNIRMQKIQPRGIVLDGRILAEKIRKEIKTALHSKEAGYTERPGLAAILVGDDPASHVYVRLKEKAAQEVGIHFHRYACSATTSQHILEEVIDFLNADESIHGILVQLPLPKGLDENAIIQRIDPRKDADGFHKRTSVLSPPLAATVRFLQETKLPLKNKRAVCIVNSEIFGKGLTHALRQVGLRVATASPQDPLLGKKTLTADVLVTAVGKANLLKTSMVKDGAVVIDIGTTHCRGKTVGDVDFKNVQPKASFITPVPGGIGPMTVAYLLHNTYTLWKKEK